MNQILVDQGIQFALIEVSSRPDLDILWPRGTAHYHCRITRGTQSFSFYHSQTTGNFSAPSLEQTVWNLAIEAAGYDSAATFADWATGRGLSTDSRSAESRYKLAGRYSRQLKKLFGSAYPALIEQVTP